MKTLMLFLTLSLFCSCRHTITAPKEPSNIDGLREKTALYREKLAEIARADSNGWPASDCDALLWASLYVVVGGDPHLDTARDHRGRWHRTPDQHCYPEHSKSTISGDMLLGLAFASWRQKATERARQIVDYGDSHRGPLNVWIMGDGAASRAWVRAPLQWTWREVVARLGGAVNEKAQLEVWPTVTGFEAHLQALHIWLRAEMEGGVTKPGLAALARLASAQPRNALFQALHHRYTDGDQAAAVAILSDEALFPAKRLPTAGDRCEGYLWQRDAVKDGQANDDWLPCDRINSHMGLDFLVAIEAMGAQ